MESFSNRIKQEILQISPKIKNCCMYSFLYGMTFPLNNENGLYITYSTFVKNVFTGDNLIAKFISKKSLISFEKGCKCAISGDFIRYFTIAEIASEVFKCPHCRENFIKGLFLTSGSATALDKPSRLELVFSNNFNALDLRCYLSNLELKFNISKRNDKTILYIKRSELIEDFLALMGANNSAFEMMNRKINNEVRNTANRATNCDSANINKALNASKKYIEAINHIISNNQFDGLTPSLQEIANLRVQFPDISIEELGKKLSPQISKSGVYHRLENILKYSKNIDK